MVITDVRVIRLEGCTTAPGKIYDNRAVIRVAPTDIHPGFKKAKGHISVTHTPNGDGTYSIIHHFLQIETDEAVTGLAGPISNPGPMYYILTQLRPFLIGQDPWNMERLWDIMYRNTIDSRKGDPMQAISYVDIALWDIRSKCLGQPLYRLLGGATRQSIPAYANTVGFSQDPESVVSAVRELKAAGYTAIKWGIMYGPAAGEEGIRKTTEIFRVLRDTAGPDMTIMLDAWSSWDTAYTMRIAERLREFDIAWIEEPVLPDLVESYSDLNRRCPIPISGGEHEYTRWGFHAMLRRNACDIYQPDPAWSGGISEVLKIISLISAYDKQVSLHNSIPSLGAHLSCAYASNLIPWAEYLILVGEATQYFLKTPCRPVNGYFNLPSEPGVGLELDESKIIRQTDVRFDC